jgi:hypothetical protein
MGSDRARGGILEVMKPHAGSRRHLASSPFQPPEAAIVATFEPEERVTHDKYGLGRVVSVEGDQAVVVDFGNNLQVRLMRPFAKLNKL